MLVSIFGTISPILHSDQFSTQLHWKLCLLDFSVIILKWIGCYSSVLKSCILLNNRISISLLYELSFFPTAKSLGTAALQPQEGLLERAGGREGEAMSKVLKVFLSSRGAASSSWNCAAEWEHVPTYCTSWAGLARAGSLGPHPSL